MSIADDPTRSPAWTELATLADELSAVTIRELIKADPHRPARMTPVAAGVHLDLSRQRITPEVVAALLALAEVHVDMQRVVELRHGLDGELHVDDRAGDAGHAPDAGGGLGRCGHSGSLS